MKPLFRLLLLGCWLLSVRLSAQPLYTQPLVLAKNREVVSLREHLAFFLDSSNTQTIADVSRPAFSSRFSPVATPVPNFGYVTGLQAARPTWLRFMLKSTSSRPENWYAEIDFWCFEELQLFVVDSQGKLLAVSPQIGWKTPVAQRPRHHRCYWLPFTLPPGQPITVYLRALKRRGTQIIPVNVVPESAYESVTVRGYLFWGGVLFTLAFVTVMSLFFFAATLDRIYSKYIVCLLGLIGFFFINDGFMNQFAFEAQFWLPFQNVYFLFPLVLFYSQLLFVRSFLSLRHTPAYRWHTIGTVVLWAGAACLVALTVEWFQPFTPTTELVMMRVFSVLYWLPMPVIVAYIIVSIVRRYHVREAWVYLVAVTPFYTLNLGQVFANFRLIPTYEWVADLSDYALAGLFEVLVLTFGLAYRYKADRDQTEKLIKEQTIQQQRTYEAEVRALALKNSLLVEKERIARDLHDNVGAHLAFVVTNLTHIRNQAEKRAITDSQQWADQLRTIVNHTRDAVKLLRETIWAIHQENFTVEEFAERLNQYINRYVHETDGLQVDVLITGSQTYRLTSTQVLNLFRIVQEALNNVVKHARATQATVRLHVGVGGRISLQIHDNGRGFSWTNGAVAEHHYGMQNMQSRALELGGTFRVFADQGTTVSIEVE